MGANKTGLQLKGFEEYMAKLDKLGGNDAMKKGVEKALTVSKDYVNPQIEKAMATGNLPAGGKYSKGGTKASINQDKAVSWSGLTGEIKIGFDFKKSGLKSIVLMYGTPKMKPVPGLHSAIYGTKTNKEIAKLQGEALNEAVKNVMEGK